MVDFNKVLLLNPKNQVAKTQLDTTKKLIRRIEFEKVCATLPDIYCLTKCQAIETEEEDPIKTCTEAIAQNACEVESDYTGPKMNRPENGTYSISQDFVDAMLEHFKNGGKLPRRYVWEIVLGCASVCAQEESLVDVSIDEKVTIDVIGDVHGTALILLSACLPKLSNRAVLRRPTFT